MVQSPVTDAAQILAARLSDLLPAVIAEERKNHAQNGIGRSASVQDLIRSCANRNCTFGLESPNEFPNDQVWPQTSMPEIAQMMANHLRMLFNIGKTYGKTSETLGLELLTSLLFKALECLESGDLLRLADGRTIFNRPAEEAFKTLLTGYSENVCRHLEKARIVKFLPTVVPMALAAWGTFSANEIGKAGIEFLSREIVLSPEINRSSSVSEKASPVPSEAETRCDMEKVKLLINLLKDDHVPEERKAALAEPFLGELRLEEIESRRLRKKVADTKPFRVDLQVFQQRPIRKIDLMIDLVGLAFFDLKITPARTAFVKNTGKDIGFSTEDLESLLNDSVRTLAFKGHCFSFRSH